MRNILVDHAQKPEQARQLAAELQKLHEDRGEDVKAAKYRAKLVGTPAGGAKK